VFMILIKYTPKFQTRCLLLITKKSSKYVVRLTTAGFSMNHRWFYCGCGRKGN